MAPYSQVAPTIMEILGDYSFSNMHNIIGTTQLEYDPSGRLKFDGFRLASIGEGLVASDLILVRSVMEKVKLTMDDMDVDLSLRAVSGGAPRVFNYEHELHPFIVGECDEGCLVIDPSLQEVMLFDGSGYVINRNDCDFEPLEKPYLILEDKCDVPIYVNGGGKLIRLVALVDREGMELVLSYLAAPNDGRRVYSVSRRPFESYPVEEGVKNTDLEEKLFNLVENARRPSSNSIITADNSQ